MLLRLKRGEADDSDMPKRSFKVLPLSKRVKVFNLIRKEENCMQAYLRHMVPLTYMMLDLMLSKPEFKANSGNYSFSGYCPFVYEISMLISLSLFSSCYRGSLTSLLS